jgi:hypothetical protein
MNLNYVKKNHFKKIRFVNLDASAFLHLFQQ